MRSRCCRQAIEGRPRVSAEGPGGRRTAADTVGAPPLSPRPGDACPCAPAGREPSAPAGGGDQRAAGGGGSAERPGEPGHAAATSSIPQSTPATAAAGGLPRHPEPDATAPGGGEKTHPPERKGRPPVRLAQPMRRVTRSYCRRRGLRSAQLRSSPKGPLSNGHHPPLQRLDVRPAPPSGLGA